MASPIAESWVYATMMVQNEWGGLGTGFLVFRHLDENKGRVFLITNKHVIHEEQQMRLKASRVLLHLNVKQSDGSIVGNTVEMPLKLPDDSRLWREHPDKDVDVLAIDVTSLVVSHPEIEKRWADYSGFGDKAKLAELDVTVGDEVVVIGYPQVVGFEFKQGATNLPLVRTGTVATTVTHPIVETSKLPDESVRRRTLRGFLIDGATIPGSSGSPVVLKPVTGRYVKGAILMGSTPAILLGIIAETRYAPVHTAAGDIPSFAGLGLAFYAETIRETIELFF